MTDGRVLPRWLPLLVLGLLVLPLAPWLDFERARRAMLLLCVGLLLLAHPSAFRARAPGGGWLAACLLWLALASVSNTAALCWPDAALRWLHWLCLLLLLRVGAATGGAPWRHAGCWVLIAAAAVGIAQRLGVPLGSLGILGTAAEPVSLFGNRNVAAEFVAVAGAAAALALPHYRRLALCALLCGGAYAVLNGSRSALVALPFVLTVAALVGAPRPALQRLWPLLAVLLGGAAGALLQAVAAPPDAPALPPASVRTATLEVRIEIGRGGLQMLADAPVFGHGPGQFAVQYPRYRSQREIELSSLRRAEMRSVGTAHDDWLEVAIDGGAPALLLLLAYCVVRWRQAQGHRDQLLPLLAFAALMCVRSPLGNAPAAALALLASAGTSALAPALAPTMVAGAVAARRAVLWPRLLGLGLAAVGALTTVAALQLGRYLQARGEAPLGDPAWLERSLGWWPADAAVWQLLAQERQARATSRDDALAALDAAEHAAALRPHEPSYLLLVADLLRLCGRPEEAKKQLQRVALLDPGEPQVNVQLAGIYFTEHDVEGTVAALYADPPPVLRRQLPARLEEFAALARAAGDRAGSLRLLAEASFVRALDATGPTDARAAVVAREQFETMRLAFAAADLQDTDPRLHIVLALLALDLGNRETAAAAATVVQRSGRSLPVWLWPLLRAPAARLRALPEWAALLPAG